MIILDEDYKVAKALRELDHKLPVTFPKMTINVVGGFAMQTHRLRKDKAEATDLDRLP